MKKRIFGMLLALVMALALLPATAFAEEAEGGIVLGTDGIRGYDASEGYDYIYFGTWNGEPIKWRVLDDQTNTGITGLFLLSDGLLGTGYRGGVKFGSGSKAWQDSKARVWCMDFAGIEGTSVPDAFSAAELAAILETTKSDEEYVTPTEPVEVNGRPMTLHGARFPAVENILNRDKVFFLSVAEAKSEAYGLADADARAMKFNGEEACWWLRSPN